jgi:hypothetical protein
MDEAWIRLLMELGGWIIVGAGFVWAIKTDTKLLAQRINMTDKRLDRVENILEKISVQQARMDVTDERMLQQGRRVDENASKIDAWIREVYTIKHQILEERLHKLENGGSKAPR